jgi:hypothetical protein
VEGRVTVCGSSLFGGAAFDGLLGRQEGALRIRVAGRLSLTLILSLSVCI